MKWICCLCVLVPAISGFADQGVYSDELDNGWQNWSWASVNLSNSSPVHGGAYSISVTETAGYQALYLHHSAQSADGFEALVFWVNGGATGGQLLQVQGTLNGGAIAAYPLPPLAANTWTRVVVPLKAIGVWGANNFDGFWLQDRSGTAQGEYYVDDISVESMPSPAEEIVYADALGNGWSDWSWASVNFANTNPVQSGTYSIAVQEKNAGDGFYVHHDPQDGSLYSTISFWINGGAAGGQSLNLVGTAGGVAQATYALPPLAANSWKLITVPLTELGIGYRGDFDGFWIQGTAPQAQPVYYIDQLQVNIAPVVNPTAVITVNFKAKTSISPYVYGINPPSTTGTNWGGLGTGFTFARMGGNRLTAYNWENNASNAGSDWQYENDGLMGATDEPGWAQRTFIQSVIGSGAIPLVTIPMAGYVSADKSPPGDVRNSGPNYLQTRFRIDVAAKPGGQFAYPPDVTDAYVYQDECVNYLKQFAQPKFPIFFELDNEPDIWSSTHAEIHPNATTYAELLSDTVAYSSAIKAVYPGTTIFGPASYGWEGFISLQNAPDANGRDFLSFYLQGMQQAGVAAQKRLLDVLDLHWYPEATGDGIRIVSDGDSPGLSDARIQAPRSLWDPTYVENSWIAQSLGNAPIDLLPGVLGRINSYYPGTKLAFTEYQYGGSNAISGAIAQADVLGIFGRYGVFAGANWGINSGAAAEVAGYNAFINYDRNGSKFGTIGLAVSGETPSQNSVYAAMDQTFSVVPTRVTLVVINKTAGTTPFTIRIPGFAPSIANAYTIVDQQFSTPTRTALPIGLNSVSFDAPPYSVSTIELKSPTSRR
ncbi:MAG: glycoside hydrolase family 44 protein [Fimbriimonadaceae bacterium]